jgi:hypothetical protein
MIMPWNMAPVEAPASAVKTPLDQIPEDVSASVEEAYAFCQENPAMRLIVPFESDEDVAVNRGYIRSYCEARKDGRLTASIWAGYTNEDASVFVQKATEDKNVPALSLFLIKYVRRERTAASNTSSNASETSG